jgi:2-isopropylmalate synthase
MITTSVSKYIQPKPFDFSERKWPSRSITKSPIWVSVDLRDGNQALPNPLTPRQKMEYFRLLCNIGFKNIEIAFPSASQDDFDFTRRLIDEDLIPEDVFIMTLTQCRDHLIDRTFEALNGVRQAIFHAYLATSDLHIRQVFDLTPEQAVQVAIQSVTRIRKGVENMPDCDIRLEFSPEEFTDTDLDYCLEVCEAVYTAWGRATTEKPLILNLPATVERRPPNQYADMVELFCSRFSHPENVLISLHAHNDQGMAVAATELAILAGGQRVEGTLFGHGERTGNVDLVVLANNFRARGVETGLDFSDLPQIADTVERLTGMPTHYRAPYSGEYVFTAFSGSHQDAIRKGMNRLDEAPEKFGLGWKVPYLHVDPTDLGRKYESLIRINSQSGKGGVVWVLEQEFGLHPPRAMHPEIGSAVQEYADEIKREVSSSEVKMIFDKVFIHPNGPYRLLGYWPRPDKQNPDRIHGELHIMVDGQERKVSSDGNGPISAFVSALSKLDIRGYSVDDYHEQAVGKGADATAVAYVPLKFEGNGVLFGVGEGTNIDQAAVRAIIAGLNRWATLKK